MGTLLTTRRLGLLATVAVILAAACSDSPIGVQVGVYNNVADARQSGAIAAGWVPEGVPPGAGDLREGHLSDGRHWGVFSFKPADERDVRALIGTEITGGTLSCEPPRRLEWWPRLLMSRFEVGTVQSTGFRLYKAAGGRTYAINWGQGRAYYWHG
jgi:hypothetical protein